MLTKIMKYEWRNLTADWTARLVIALFGGLILFAVWNAKSWVDFQKQTLAQVRQEESTRLDSLQTLARKEQARVDSMVAATAVARNGKAADHKTPPLAWGVRHPGYAGNWAGSRYAALPPGPLAAFAIGQSDMNPYYFKISANRKELFMGARELENPVKLLVGQFDLAFVIIFLYPLLILALSYNLVSSEREGGTLAMLLAQPLSLRTLVFGKIGLRALVILLTGLVFTLVAFAFSGADFSAPGLWLQLLLWSVAVTAYAALWFSLAMLVNAVGKSSATNAVALAAVWLIFVVVIPASLNLILSALHPVPSRVQFVQAMREATASAEARASELMAKYYHDHPELSKDSVEEFLIRRLAMIQDIETAMAPVYERFEGQLAKQQALVNRLQFLSPALMLQRALYAIAGTGPERYQHFVRQVERYHQTWREYFTPRILQNVAVVNYTETPAFRFEEEPPAALAGRATAGFVGLLLPTFVIGGAALRNYRRYRVAG